MEELIKLGKTQLTDIQLDVLNDCLNKKSGGLSLPMGFGKSMTAGKHEEQSRSFIGAISIINHIIHLLNK